MIRYFLLALTLLGCTKTTNVEFKCGEGENAPPPYTLSTGGLVCPSDQCGEGCADGMTCVENTEAHDRWCAICDEQTRTCDLPEVDSDAATPTIRMDAGLEPDTTHVREDAGTPEPQPDAAPSPECEDDVDCDDGLLCEEGTCTPCDEHADCDDPTPLCDTTVDPNTCVTCLENADCGECTGTVCFGGSCVTVPGGELCDGSDNDCDSQVDEVFTDLGDTCYVGVGVCRGSGSNVCSASGLGTTCTATASAPTATSDNQCNNLDDDCDGSVDEDFVPATTVCGTGACERTGMHTCEGGELVNSCTSVLPLVALDSTCNNVDDDCDGETDEDYVPSPVECGVGACHNVGLTACVLGSVVEICSENPATVETCNGQDDDCDGTIDNDQPEFTTVCGFGVCENTGTASCEGGEYTDSCAPSAATEQSDWECNNLDEDCDGESDEDYEPEAVECGEGACREVGVTDCIGGEVSEVCIPGDNSTTEVCNGIDDDCDAETDEEFENLNDTCYMGVGACRGEGRYVCAENHLSVVCDATPGSPSPETCDSRDNDCDGSVDEGLGSTTCGFGACLHTVSNCVGGTVLSCDPFAGQLPEACDGLDNDCDGTVDEGFGDLTCGVGDCAASTPACLSGVPQTCVPNAPTSEVCGNTADEDCDGSLTNGCPPPSACSCTDGDLDGYYPTNCTDTNCVNRTDCNDSNPAVHPGATVVCGDGIDNNCTGGDTPCPPTTTTLLGKVINWTPLLLSNGTARSGILYVTACRAGGAPAVLCTAGTATAPATTIASCFIPLAEVHCYNESVDVTPYATGPSGLSYSTDGDNWHCNSWAGVQRHDGTYTSSWRWQRPDGTTYDTTAPLPTCQERSGGGNNNDINPPDSPTTP